MAKMKMGVVESHFADIIWANEPLHSRELVKLCEKELNWNRSTTYTILRKLCERGIFQNNGGIVSSVLSKMISMPFRASSSLTKPLKVPFLLSLRLLHKGRVFLNRKLRRFDA